MLMVMTMEAMRSDGGDSDGDDNSDGDDDSYQYWLLTPPRHLARHL